MDTWKEIYGNKSSEINTFEPSKIVKEVFKIKLHVEKTLDLGCGNGRNSAYASKFSTEVDCVDIVDIKERKKIIR